MTKHDTKIGHALSKALAGQNRRCDSLQAVLTAASQYAVHMVDREEQEKELENLPDTPLDASEVISPVARSKKRTPVGADGWEDGFKLIRGSYWIRIQRRGKRKCVNLRTNSIRLARERREELSKLLVDGTYFGAKVPLTVEGLWLRYAKVARDPSNRAGRPSQRIPPGIRAERTIWNRNRQSPGVIAIGHAEPKPAPVACARSTRRRKNPST